MAKCSKCGSPLCKCGSPNHYSDSPAKQLGSVVGGIAATGNALNQVQQQPVAQPMTNVPPAASSLINPFSPQAQASAQGIYGGVAQRPNAVNAPLMYKDNSPLNQKDKKERVFIGEDTDEIKKDKKGEFAVDMFSGDTLRPANGKRFNPNKVVDGYIMGGDYPAIKISKKNFKLK